MRWLKLGIIMNLLNASDFATTVYAVYFLGFREANVAVVKLLEINPLLYAVVKLGFPVLLLAVYVISSTRSGPLAIGVSRGCEISFAIMTAVLGLATALNIYQIVFGADARQILSAVAKVIPTLRIR